MAIHGYILWLILNEVDKQYYPFYAEKSNLSITIMNSPGITPSHCLDCGQSVRKQAAEYQMWRRDLRKG